MSIKGRFCGQKLGLKVTFGYMFRPYDPLELLAALRFNAQETLPENEAQLQREIETLAEAANTSQTLIRHYIGFEISGQIHLGTGIMSALKIKKLTEAGVECVIFLADYHSFLNEKLDGSLESIRRVAEEYFAPVMLECCRLVGADLNLVKVVFAQEAYALLKEEKSFWDYDLHIAKHITQARVLKSISITGRAAGEGVSFATLRYPVMQTADAFFLQTHLVSAGLDQRKAHVLMREVAGSLPVPYRLRIGREEIKPIASHYHLLHGLGKPVDGQVAKMSKSKPETCIFVHESEEEIRRKIKKAYCPLPDLNKSLEENQQEQALNPLLDWCRKMIFPAGLTLRVTRPEKYGGDVTYTDYESLAADYLAGRLHPGDFKPALAECLSVWLTPLREEGSVYEKGLRFLENLNR